MHPTDASVFVAGSRSGSLAGIYKSVDGGATWRQTLGGSFHIFVYHFAASSAHPNTVYASTYGAIYRSDDAGEHWDTVNNARAEDSRLAQEISVLLIDPADNTTPEVGGYDYAYPSYEPLAPFFRKSLDAGETWTDLSAGLGAHSSVSAVAIDPVHPSTIFLGMNRQPASVVFRSTNGGASWLTADTGLPANAEVSALVMDPRDPTRLYAATDSGIYRTRDSGASWLPFGQQLDRAQIGELSFDATGNLLRAGTQFGTFEIEVGAAALDVAAGVGKSHVLSWDSDSLTVQTLEDSGGSSSAPPEGPSGSWLATAVADGADGLSRVLWVNGDGRAALDIVGTAGSEAVFRFAGQPNWSAADVSVGADGKAHVLWTSMAGAMFLASVDSSGGVTLGPSYGPYKSWTALALADAPDGSTWVLWRATDGRASVSVHRDLVMGEIFRFDSSPDWAAEDITVAADGRPRLLRVGADNNAQVSTIDALGHLTAAKTHSPGWRPRRIAAGPDGLTRLLFSDAAGTANVWLLNPDNSLKAGSEPPEPPGPTGPLSGDWTGTFDSVDAIDCPLGTPANATFTQDGATVDGVLHMTPEGCGADAVTFHGTLIDGHIDGTLGTGGNRYRFNAGSTATGTLVEGQLTLALINRSPFPYPIPGGTMRLHR